MSLFSLTNPPRVYCLMGAPFGDLEFDIGKSARWMEYFSDDMFVLDVNLGDQRYWIVNWVMTFPNAEHSVTGINFFTDAVAFRKEQFRLADAFYHFDNEDWIVWVDGSEGLSFDTRSLPDDYASDPFMSFVWREIERAEGSGVTDRVVLPFYVFLHNAQITNVSYDHPQNPSSIVSGNTALLTYSFDDTGLVFSGDWGSHTGTVTWSFSLGDVAPVVTTGYTVVQPMPVGVWRLVVNDGVSSYEYSIRISETIDGVAIPMLQQPVSVPYYLSAQGLTRMTKVSRLRGNPDIFSAIDTPSAWEVKPGTGVPLAPGYLTPTVGVATTPDPGVQTSQVTFVYTVQGPVLSTDQVVAAQWQSTAANRGWAIFARSTGVKNFSFSTTGVDSFSRGMTGAAPSGAPETYATIVNGTTGACELQRWNGTAWVSVVTATGTPFTIFDSTLALRIGQAPAGTPFTFDGRIYSVECRSGLSPTGGTVLWKFDASDYVSGTSFVSNGRTWTLTNASAITPAVPAVPSEPAVKAQIISYAYAHWQEQNIPPGATEIPPLSEANDDGFRMRKLISLARPIAGLPVAVWNPSDQPAGQSGPWAISTIINTHPDLVPTIEGAPVSSPSLPHLGIPLYDTTLRLNLRDGVWYEGDVSGNTPLMWDEATQKWVPPYDPDLWPSKGVEAPQTEHAP